MTSQIDRVETKLDQVLASQTAMIVVQTRHSIILDEHQARSKANEAAVNLLRSEVEPIKTHVAVAAGIAQAVVGLGGLVAIALGLIELWGHLAG